MSITGSLVGYENNNEISNKKNRSLLNISGSTKQCPSLNSSISNSVITSSSTRWICPICCYATFAFYCPFARLSLHVAPRDRLKYILMGEEAVRCVNNLVIWITVPLPNNQIQHWWRGRWHPGGVSISIRYGPFGMEFSWHCWWDILLFRVHIDFSVRSQHHKIIHLGNFTGFYNKSELTFTLHTFRRILHL